MCGNWSLSVVEKVFVVEKMCLSKFYASPVQSSEWIHPPPPEPRGSERNCIGVTPDPFLSTQIQKETTVWVATTLCACVRVCVHAVQCLTYCACMCVICLGHSK